MQRPLFLVFLLFFRELLSEAYRVKVEHEPRRTFLKQSLDLLKAHALVIQVAEETFPILEK